MTKQKLSILLPPKSCNHQATSVSVNLTSVGLLVSEIKQHLLFEAGLCPQYQPLQVPHAIA